MEAGFKARPTGFTSRALHEHTEWAGWYVLPGAATLRGSCIPGRAKTRDSPRRKEGEQKE